MSVLCRISAQDIFVKENTILWVEQAEEAAVAAEAFPEAVWAEVFPEAAEAVFQEAVLDAAEAAIAEAVADAAVAALAVPVISEVLADIITDRFIFIRATAGER